MISGSRSSTLLVVTSCVLLGIVTGRVRTVGLKKILVGFFIIFAILLVYEIQFNPDSRLHFFAKQIFNSSIRDLSIRNFIGDRYYLWQSGWITFKNNILVGTGIGNFLIKMPTYSSEMKVVINDNCGNMYLQVAAEQGIVGLALFLLLIGSFLFKFMKMSLHSFKILSAFASVVGLLVACLFGGHLLSFEASILFWFLLTYPYEYHQRNKTRS